jgi:hypothetical protein
MSSKQFTRKIFCWLDQVNRDCGLPAHAFKIAFGLSPDFNENEGGMAWCGFDRLSARSCTSKSTAHKMIGMLQARGHLRVEWGRRGNGGHSNQYWMVIKSEPGDLFEHAEKTSPKVRQSANFESSRRTPSKVRESGVQSSYTHSQSSPARTESTLEPSKNHRRESQTLPPVSASPVFQEGPPAESTNQPEPEVAEAFGEFWRAYPRKAAKEAARRAFAAAIKRGADPEILIAGARRYAIERAGEPARWTKHPATWLSGGCWEDEALGALIMDEDGNVVAIEEEDEADEADDGDPLAILENWERARGIRP